MSWQQFISFFLVVGLFTATPIAASSKSPPNYEKKMELGDLLYRGGYSDEAIRAYRTASTLRPDAFEPHLNLANIYLNRGNLEDAANECREVVKKKPAHGNAHLTLGRLLCSIASSEKDEQKRSALLKEAINEIESARKLNVSIALVESALGYIYVNQGNADEAVKRFDRALQIDENLTDIQRAKAIMHWRMDEKELALTHLNFVTAQAGNKADNWVTKGNLLLSMDRLKESLECYKKAVEINPKAATAWERLGQLYSHFKDIENTFQRFERFTALTGKPAEIRLPRIYPSGDFDLKLFNNFAPEKPRLEPNTREHET
ncbi:MAG: tetratricopeptide repeat protein [Cyanobacteria bacterium]|nr:tetratricopeptide repeat protein [Cyanobacteriota bacterium]